MAIWSSAGSIISCELPQERRKKKGLSSLRCNYTTELDDRRRHKQTWVRTNVRSTRYSIYLLVRRDLCSKASLTMYLCNSQLIKVKCVILPAAAGSTQNEKQWQEDGWVKVWALLVVARPFFPMCHISVRYIQQQRHVRRKRECVRGPLIWLSATLSVPWQEVGEDEECSASSL